MILKPGDNVWSITIVQRENGVITVLPVNAPGPIRDEIVQLLERALARKPAPV